MARSDIQCFVSSTLSIESLKDSVLMGVVARDMRESQGKVIDGIRHNVISFRLANNALLPSVIDNVRGIMLESTVLKVLVDGMELNLNLIK